jgi:hypothetical protein
MFSIQKTVCHGGAMKSKNFACYCCNIHKNDLVKANAVPCDDCIAGNSLHPCYHQLISDEVLIQRFRTEKCELEQHWPHLLLLPPTRSRIRFGTLDISDPRYDPLHIEYVPTSVNARIQHARLIEEELIMRGLHVIGANAAERKLQLHEVLVTEQRYKLMKEVVSCNNVDDAMIIIEKAIPCLLHLENRTSEAMIFHLIRNGLQLRENDSRAAHGLRCAIENEVNEVIFGDPTCKSNRQFPLQDDGTMGAIKFANWKA